MRKILQKVKEYFTMPLYTHEEISEFTKAGTLPEEFDKKRRKVKALFMIILFIGFLVYLAVS
jgi:uncharacterized protein with HEPN domain